MVCLQEVDHIDDFYDAELQKIGYNVVYGERRGRDIPLMKEKHTIAIAYKKDEWFMIDCLLIDLSEASKFLPDDDRIKRSKNAMLVYLQHQESH